MDDSLRDRAWPSIPLESWEDTCDTLHMWTQIVGKVRLMQAPLVNHWWEVPLYLTSRGLTTSPIPHGPRTFDITFDFFEHRLDIHTSDGESESVPLSSRSVASFYGEITTTLERLGVPVEIRPKPVEIQEAIPFDHAVTRFSGKTAPPHPGGFPNMPDWATREAYSHEVASFGFWPGKGLGEAGFYAYAYPVPDGFPEAEVRPGDAYYHPDLGEFVLPYEAVRTADDPDRMLLDFLESAYEAATDLGGWDRAELERPRGELASLKGKLAL